MKTETLVWSIIFVIGGAFLLARTTGLTSELGMAKAYMRAEEKHFVNLAGPDEDPNWVEATSDAAADLDLSTIPAERVKQWTRWGTTSYTDYRSAIAEDPNQDIVQFSIWRTVGIWLAAFFTLAIFSFVYKDNPLYKIAESIFVGVSAAYWMVVGFWDVIVPNLLGKLWPTTINNWALPGLSGRDLEIDYWYIAPLILGIMLLWRLAPRGGWISRWPLAFIIGVFCGLRLIGFLHGDFLAQIRNAIVPLYALAPQYAADGTALLDAAGNPMMAFDPWLSLQHIFLVLGVLVCLVYFFFSLEHKGVIGHTARVGIWILMITFGAGFGYTVMGRIALLAIRIEFLLDDWLWLIDPTEKRVIIETAATLWPTLMQMPMVC